MTKKERAKPELLNASRRKRIAKGAGVDVSEINKLIKMHRQMADMMKKVSKNGAGGLAGMFGGMGKKMLSGGGMPDMDPAQIEDMAKKMGADPSKLPDDFSKLAKQSGGPSLPGLGGNQKFPGLPGLPGLPGKKK